MTSGWVKKPPGGINSTSTRFGIAVVHKTVPPPESTPEPEPAVVESHDYQREITQRAAQLGVREQDLAYTVAYRAALQATNTNHTAA